MNSIAEIFDNSKQLLDGITTFVDKYIGCDLLRRCGIRKIIDSFTECRDYEYIDNPILRLIGDVKTSKVLPKCVSAKKLLMDKILACFHTAASPYIMFKTGTFFSDYKKDTFYRFDLNEKANWERLQLETARNVILDIESRTDKDHINALIFDDSLYRRTGGKGTDLCAKVFDHNDNKMRVGYRMMTGGWSNSETYIPFMQSLLSTRKQSLMIGKDEHVDRRTLRGKRRARAKEKGTIVVQSMVQEAQKAGIPFDYVLFDTWFSNPAQLVALKDIGADVIAMIKKNSTKYTLLDPTDDTVKDLNVKEIYSRFKKRSGRSKYLLCVNVRVSDRTGNSVPAKLVFARNRNNKKQWICFVCTDMRCSPEDVLRIYTMRWACLCEPCFYANSPHGNAANKPLSIMKSSHKFLSPTPESGSSHPRHPARAAQFPGSLLFFCLRSPEAAGQKVMYSGLLSSSYQSGREKQPPLRCRRRPCKAMFPAYV